VAKPVTDDLFSSETFREIADAMPTGLWRISATFEQDWVNKHWLDFTGGSLEEEVSFAWIAKIHPDDRQRVVEEFDRAFKARQATQVEFRLRGRDGSYRWFLDSGAPFYRDGEFAGFVGACTDITERKRSEAHKELLQAELIERSGAEATSILGSMVVHEVSQPLTAITSYADALRILLAGRPELPPEFAEAAASIGRAADRARQIVRNCKTIVANGKGERRREDLSTALRAVEPLIRLHPAAAGARLDWNLAADLFAQISMTQIQQVLLNLATNGLQAMQNTPGRALTISAANWGDAAIISVADRGPGVPEATREQIFEAFESGKADGMGLGLYLSRLIITGHGGRIWVEDNPEGGAIFRFKIPLENGLKLIA
jgi:PAS domain S-box-containing protein